MTTKSFIYNVIIYCVPEPIFYFYFYKDGNFVRFTKLFLRMKSILRV